MSVIKKNLIPIRYTGPGDQAQGITAKQWTSVLKGILSSAWIEWQPSKLHVVGSSPTGCTATPCQGFSWHHLVFLGYVAKEE